MTSLLAVLCSCLVMSCSSRTEFSNVSFLYHVDEDIARGSVIADLFADFTRVYPVDEEDRSQLRFLVFDQSSDVAVKRFDVDERTGIITTSLLPGGRLDREELCDAAARECVLTSDVVVQPYFQLVKVKVEDWIQGRRSSLLYRFIEGHV